MTNKSFCNRPLLPRLTEGCHVNKALVAAVIFFAPLIAPKAPAADAPA